MDEISVQPSLMVGAKQIPLEDLAMLALLDHPHIKSSIAKQLYWWFAKVGRGAPVPYPGGTLTSRLLGTTRSGLGEGMKLLTDAKLLEVVHHENGSILTVKAVIPDTVSQELGILYVEWMTLSSPGTAQSPKPRTRRTKPKDESTSAPPADPAQSGEDIRADAAATDKAPEKKAKRLKLQDEDVALITSSFETMKAWLLFGLPGAKDPTNENLPPSNVNWRVFRRSDTISTDGHTPEGLGVKDWQAPHFSAYFWLQVADWRRVRGISQTIPQIDILCGHMKNLAQQVGGNWKLFRYIGVLCQHFDLCCAMVGKLGENLMLAETMLQQPQLKQVAIQLMDMSQLGIQQLYDQYERQRVDKFMRQNQTRRT
jgi:hypothetical protein